MLEDLSEYENLGTPAIHFKILELLSNGKNLTEKEILSNFHNQIIDNRNVFDGCIPFLIQVNAITINEDGKFCLHHEIAKSHFSMNAIIGKIVQLTFERLQMEDSFHSVFRSQYVSYDIVHKKMQIDNAAFPLKYSNFKQMLLDFNILEIHPTIEFRKFILGNKYRRLFDKFILPEVRKRRIGVEEFDRALRGKQKAGEQAEIYVLEFEKKRLGAKSGIEWVADYSIAEGYDIASFEAVESFYHDRFIEVKSFMNSPSFYWSRNEIDVARQKREKYFLYLVDREKLTEPKYEPIMIRDPYHNVLLNKEEWNGVPQSIMFKIVQKNSQE